ncbi:DUF551 domain-containing protein [Pandoraea captiosa]|uniref:DUF551 domain-containing protein n=1 Tax=Pandoraea captiosa TaxID=2508302 RepID=UPI001242E161
MTPVDWISSSDRLPAAEPGRTRVTVLAVVNDPTFLAPGELPFVDIATYWRERGIWTITCRSEDRSVSDLPVLVSHWMNLPALPILT